MLRASIVIAFVFAAATSSCRQPPTRDAGRSARGTGKPAETRARPRTVPRPSTTPCEFTTLRSVGTNVHASGEMTMGFVSGHLGVAWIGANGAALGSELRDNGAILRPLTATDDAPANGGHVVWSRAFPRLDPRSALAATLDVQREADAAGASSDAETGSLIELRCGEVFDTTHFNMPSVSLVNRGAMFACRSLGDAMPFVIGIADVRGTARTLRLFARRSALPIPTTWDADRFADAAWTFAIEPATAGDHDDVFERASNYHEPEALVAAEAPGRGSLVAIAVEDHLYFGWLDARLAAASPLHRIASATHVTGAAVAWNGYEALLVYTDEENGAARVMASRVTARGGASSPVQIATTPATSNAVRSPSVAAFGNGEWGVAWIEASRISDNALPGIARLQVLRTDLTPREAAHGWGGDQLSQVRIASRGESVVIGVLAGSDDTAHVDVASARCASSGYVPPPAVPATSEAVRPIALPSITMPPGDGGVACTALPRRPFLLRASATARTGSETAPMLLTVLQRGTQQRGDSTIHRVRTEDGATGWVFLAPNELGSGCGSQPPR